MRSMSGFPLLSTPHGNRRQAIPPLATKQKPSQEAGGFFVESPPSINSIRIKHFSLTYYLEKYSSNRINFTP